MIYKGEGILNDTKNENMKSKNMKRKKIFGMFIAGMLSFCTLLTGFSEINSVQAKIDTNLPKSYMSDDFPDSYKPYIDALKSAHPNWVFKAVYTGLDWNQAVSHESYDINEKISLVPDSYDAVWKKDGQNNYVDGNFVTASKEAVKYMLDPRGHLNEKEVFQFQTLSYSSSMDSINSIEKVLYGTSMYNRSEYQRQGSMVNLGRTYSSIILEAAQKYNVSAIHVASRIKQETGGNITSNRSINGSTVINGVVPYNYFNIGATPPDSDTNGLKYAVKKGWTDPVNAINGGTDILRNNWIKWGQDTTYFQKFDVNNPYGNAVGLYAYQYMANIIAPTNESYSTYNAYQKMGLLDSSLEFHVPVFNNMPEYPTPYPGESEITYVSDNTRICAYDVAPYKLYIRSGPGTDYSIVAKLGEGDEMTRIAKSVNTQWDKVRLDSGVEGYVFRDYTKEISKDIKVTGISLNQSNLELKIGDTYTLISTLTPDNATNKNVEWSTSNNDIVSVENGKITAKNKGETIITVKSLDTGVTAECNVKVIKKATGISLSKDSISFNSKDNLTQKLLANVLPQDASVQDVDWKSNDEKIATVDREGNVTAVGSGKCVITATTKDGTNLSSNCNVTVDVLAESISFDKDEYILNSKDIKNLSVILNPKESSKTLEWKSSNTKIAKVDNGGNVTPVENGKCIITATTTDGSNLSTSCNVVVDIKTEKISLDKTSYTFNEPIALELKATVLPKEASKDLKWTSSDENVAKVTSGGIVVPVGKGSCKITVETTDGTNLSESCSITSNITYLRGDITRDGKVDMEDVYTTMKRLARGTLSDEDKLIVEVTNDGRVDMEDIYKMLKYIARKITVL